MKKSSVVKVINKFNLNKKGISEIVSYVLLVVLAVGLATATYYFLLEQTNVIPEDICPKGVSITIENYSCENGLLNLTIKNSGLFNVGGVRIKGIKSLETNFEFDLKTVINSANTPLNVTDTTQVSYINYKGLNVAPLQKIRIYPYVLDKTNKSFVCQEAFSEVTIGEDTCP